MDFGLFCLMNQRSGTQTVIDILSHTSEQVQAAEMAGFKTAWFAEHHFSNYSLTPSPLMMVAHMAAQTTKIQLATGVLVLPLYHPARLLGEIGMADQMAQGRLVLGIGSGYQPFEFDRFGLNLEEAKDRTLEMLEILEAGLTETEVSFDGQYISQANTQINVRPVENRMPEVWVAGGHPDLLLKAARKNYTPIITGRLFGPEFLVAQKEYCSQFWTQSGHSPTKMNFSTLGAAHICETKAEARDFAENLRFQARLAFQLRHRTEVLENGMLVESPLENELSLDEIVDNLIVGDAETCAEKCVEVIKKVNPKHMALYFTIGSVTHDRAMHSIETFGSEVIPAIEKEVGSLALLN